MSRWVGADLMTHTDNDFALRWVNSLLRPKPVFFDPVVQVRCMAKVWPSGNAPARSHIPKPDMNRILVVPTLSWSAAIAASVAFH